ncbi:ATP synthase F0 subunit B [Desulfobaculum bizertense]|uniref:F-type H+-transporting ATPase subunit b n=1 Tax=Desulfobaculum bizertense DSM 18034 TaxID=1121442 RepID=A0A1T4WU55_9BACT|nr:ATP synthase F0 subunit B [Desulfobaculum bizertense]UIJ37255.1 ATP synthase F0 subunit B [Desulfobaculum bizertense]SKA80161.1 F-type H+-transporting ATPase subunit b [Desulfobaculum bizertense DSM 18034]
MIDLDITFFIQLVNFVVTLVVLNFLLIRPIREIIKKRNERMEGYVKDAEGFSAAATGKLEKYSAQLDAARHSGVEIRNGLRDEGVKEEQSIVGAATQKAAAQMKTEREAVAAEAKECMVQLKGQVSGLANNVVAKVLG